MHDNANRTWLRSGSLGLMAMLLGVLCMGLGGCGTNLNELLYQTASSVGRTAFDLWLTDQANQLTDSDDNGDDDPTGGDDGDADDGDEPDDADGDDGDDGDPGGDDGGGIGGGDLTGDPSSGEIGYNSNGCAACHCADATGGCALSAPGLIGVDAATLDDFLRGDASHPSKADLTDQQIVDLEAYLASIGG